MILKETYHATYRGTVDLCINESDLELYRQFSKLIEKAKKLEKDILNKENEALELQNTIAKEKSEQRRLIERWL